MLGIKVYKVKLKVTVADVAFCKKQFHHQIRHLGSAFEHNFVSGGRYLNKPNMKTSNARGGYLGKR